MHATERFTLEQHTGPYEAWPAKTRLWVDGKPSAVQVPGYQLLKQFVVDDGYLLITDYDCPYEEATSFILLDQLLQLVSRKTVGAPYCSECLERIDWLSPRQARVVFYRDVIWSLTIRRWGLPYLRPRLVLKPADTLVDESVDGPQTN